VGSGVLSRICKMRKETCAPHECKTRVYVGLEHIDSGRCRLSRHGAPSEVRSAKSRFYPGDVLYGKLRPYLDKAVVAETEGICSTDILVLEPLEAPSWFLCGVLHTDPFIEHAKQTTHGVNHPRTSWSGIKVFESLSLSPPEQKKIGAVLLKIQRAIETQEKTIQSLGALKKSTMQHLFTRGVRGEKTKMTEIGEIPKSWEVVRMEVLGEIVTGTTPPTKRPEYYQGGGYQFIAPADLGETMRIYRSEKEISEQGLAVSRVLPRHATCFVCIGSSIGKVGITVAEASASNQQINAIIPYRDFDPFFVTFLLLHRSAYIAGFASPSPVPILSKGKFEEIVVPITRKKDEQKRIREYLLGIENKIELHESKKSRLQDLFRTALNKLMTGKIRVNNSDIDVSEIE